MANGGISIAFLTPANAMLSVELTNLANILESAGQFSNISTLARNTSAVISAAIWNNTVRKLPFLWHQVYIPFLDLQVENGIFAYETNGK